MGNAIQFGTYRISFILILFLLSTQLSAQDLYIDKAGVEHKVELTRWYLNQAFIKKDDQVKPLFINELNLLYRDQAQVVYVPYSNYVQQADYLNFLIPTVESLRALRTDYFRDEHLEVWISGNYLVYHITSANYVSPSDFFDVSNSAVYQAQYNDPELFEQKGLDALPKVQNGVVFIYHDDVGFSKIVSSDMEDDYFKLQISKYTFDSNLNDSIFGQDFKLKSRKFLDFFDQEISHLTAIQYSDDDLARYYISSLHQEGALILLLNLDKRKIDLYRNAGNTKLADKLEEELLIENKSLALAFLEKGIYNFSALYVTDAKNRNSILNGIAKNIFLDANLKVDSAISLKEEFHLFARGGQVFETQMMDQNNPHKKQVTSTTVIQDALVIYDHNNIQLMDPFPFFVRQATAQINAISRSKKNRNNKVFENKNGFEDVKTAVSSLKESSGFEQLETNKVGLALSFNTNFKIFYEAISKGVSYNFRHLNWRNDNILLNNYWQPAPNLFPSNSQPALPPGLPKSYNNILNKQQD